MRSSNLVKAPSSTAASVKQASVPPEVQPHCGPSMMARTRLVTPAVERSTPRRSKAVGGDLGNLGDQRLTGDEE